MKIQLSLTIPLIIAIAAISCSKANEGEPGLKGGKIRFEAANIEMAGSDMEQASTRAVSDFVVNGASDPTLPIESKQGWTLNVQIYDGTYSKPYEYGKATLLWDTGTKLWLPQGAVDFHFPNYSKQPVSATLSPTGFITTVSTDQNTAEKLIAQDALAQNGALTVTVNPAHKPTISMRHANSMVDFIVSGVEFDDLSKVSVFVGTTEYMPYNVKQGAYPEYMVILPAGSAYPEVRIETSLGAKYKNTLNVPATAVNTCYCAKLVGVELILGQLTIQNWVTGEAISGDYSTVTSYPTFRGYPGTTVTLRYLNGNTQPLKFNQNGEAPVEKPLGRSITSITDGSGTFTLDPYLVLNNMIVDLRPRIDARK